MLFSNTPSTHDQAPTVRGAPSLRKHPNEGDRISPSLKARHPARITSLRSAASVHNHALNESDEESTRDVTVTTMHHPTGEDAPATACAAKVRFVQPLTQEIPAQNASPLRSATTRSRVNVAPTYYDGEYVIDSVVDHGMNDDQQLLYRVRWHGYQPQQRHLANDKRFPSQPPAALLSKAQALAPFIAA